jgi:hypothetical protein
MRFQVPQFIEIEDKIFGQLTFKQFVYMGGGLAMSFVVYQFLPVPIYISLIVILPILAFAGALAFYKPYNPSPMPFSALVESAFKYIVNEKLYIWKKHDRPVVSSGDSQPIEDLPMLAVPKLSDSKLKDLTWSLDINNSVYSDKRQR